MHVSSPDLTCSGLGRGPCWGWGTWGLQTVPGSPPPHLCLSPVSTPCPHSCCGLPSRKTVPRLASPRWPRQGWRSSGLLRGRPGAASSQPGGVPPGPRGPLHPLVFRAPISPGPKSSPRQKGLKGKPVTAVGPSRLYRSVAIRVLTVPSRHAEPGVCLLFINHQERSSLEKVLSPLLASCISTVQSELGEGHDPLSVYSCDFQPSPAFILQAP